MEQANSLKVVILMLGILLRMYSSLKNSSTGVNNVCIEYRKNVSVYVKDIIYNMSTKTAPVSYCGWCSETVNKLRLTLEDQKAYNSDGRACVDLLANTEKGTIDSVDFIFDKWNRSFCSHCLEGSSNRNIGKLADSSHNIECPKHHLCMDSLYNLKVYNEKVRTFFDKLDDVLSCFMQFVNNPNISILNVLNFPSPSALNISSMVCQNCSVAYYSLLDFYTNTLLRYNSLDGWRQNVYLKEYSSYRFAVCSDVQNAVNRTQWAWYNLFKCRTEEINPIGFFLPLLVCIVFLIIFHSLAQSVCRYPVHLMVYRPKRVEPTVRSQQRLLSTSSLTHGQMSLVRSYGSIGSVVENNSVYPNTIIKHYSHPVSLFDNRTILLQTIHTKD